MSNEPMKTVGGRGKVLANDVDDQAEVEQVAQGLRAAVTDDQYAWPEYEPGTMAAAATNTAVMPQGKQINFIHLDRVPIELDHAIEALLRKHGEIGARTLTLDQIVESLGDWLADRAAGREETGPARWRARLIEEFSG